MGRVEKHPLGAGQIKEDLKTYDLKISLSKLIYLISAWTFFSPTKPPAVPHRTGIAASS